MSEAIQIERWFFWSPESGDPADWRQQYCRRVDDEPGAVAPSDLVPATARRRMSSLSRMSVHAALAVTRDLEVDYSVFCSRHGELRRSHRLLIAIAAGEELSPAEFSQAVHNTSSGLYSIIRKTHSPTCSIASGAASFGHGWMEAEGFLAENPNGRVLLVDYDERPPVEYSAYLPSGSSSHVVALLLRVGRDAGLSLRVQSSSSESDLPMGPLFLSAWLTNRPAIEVDAERQRFIWKA